MVFRRHRDWEESYDEHYADRQRRREPGSRRMRVLPHLLSLLFVGGLFVGAAGAISGQAMAERLLVALVSPCGLVWLGLLILVYFSLLLRQSWPATAGFLCWLILTLGGNALLTNRLAAMRERDYLQTDVWQRPAYDILFVLGGGTSSTVAGGAQADADGDRVVIAARLYHAGKAKRLVCTGTQTNRSSPKDQHPHREATEILIGLNVPADKIDQIRGNDTQAEMGAIKKYLDQHNLSSARIGILSSAWHLPRAIRLAQSQGFTAEGVPAAFLTRFYQPSPSMLLPSAENLRKSSLLLKEYLADWVAR